MELAEAEGLELSDEHPELLSYLVMQSSQFGDFTARMLFIRDCNLPLCSEPLAPVAHAIGSLAKSMPPDLCFHVSISHETSLSLAFVVAHIP